MKRLTTYLWILSMICFFMPAGCLPAPRGGDASLVLSVSLEQAREARALDEIAAVTATASRNSLKFTVDLLVSGNTAAGEFTGLYAGEWSVRVEAKRADGSPVYAGATQVAVQAGATSSAALTLRAAPGSLEARMDVSALLAQGMEVTGGRFAYAAGSGWIYKDMTLEGSRLHILLADLPPLTYDAKIAIPNASKPIFTTDVFRFEITPGRKTNIAIGSDGGITLALAIRPEPPLVSGLTVLHVEKERVDLRWEAAAGATGYRIYRTDAEGRFDYLAEVGDGGLVSYADLEFGEADPHGGRVGYAVSALSGEQEGYRSEPVYVKSG